MEIIDTHVYFGRNDYLGFNYGLEDLLEAKAKYSLDNLRFLIISATPDTNKTISEFVSRNAELVLGAYLIIEPRKNMPWGWTPLEKLHEHMKKPQVKGLKFVSSLLETAVNSPVIEPYLELAKEFEVPFMVHCGATGTDYTSYKKVKEVVERHPNTNVILAHFGGLNPKFIDGSMSLAKQFKNVYLNTAGMSGDIKRYEVKDNKIPRLIEWYTDTKLRDNWRWVLYHAMCDRTLSEKILFGTDYPELSHDLYPLDILREDQQEKIRENTVRLFRL